MAFFVMLDYELFKVEYFHWTFWPFWTTELQLIEFYQANLQFSNAFKLVLFGPKSYIQVLEKVPKAILVMLDKQIFMFSLFC